MHYFVWLNYLFVISLPCVFRLAETGLEQEVILCLAGVSGRELHQITMQDLEDLGVAKVGQRVKVMQAIKSLGRSSTEQSNISKSRPSSVILDVFVFFFSFPFRFLLFSQSTRFSPR